MPLLSLPGYRRTYSGDSDSGEKRHAQSAGGSTTIGSDDTGFYPTAEVVQQITAAAKRGEIDAAVSTVTDAESMMALTLPGRTFAEVCWYGALHGKANQVLTLCDEAVRRLPDDPETRDKRGLARALTGNATGAIEDFRFFVQKLEPQVSPQSNIEPAERVRIRKIWIQQLEAGQFPFNASVIDDLWKVEGESPWVSNESGQLYYASGSARPRTVTYQGEPLPILSPNSRLPAPAPSRQFPFAPWPRLH